MNQHLIASHAVKVVTAGDVRAVCYILLVLMFIGLGRTIVKGLNEKRAAAETVTQAAPDERFDERYAA